MLPFLTVGPVLGLSAEVDVTAIGMTVAFASTTTEPIAIQRDDSDTNGIVQVCSLRRSTSGTAANNIGGRIGPRGREQRGGVPVAGYLSWRFTNATSGRARARLPVVDAHRRRRPREEHVPDGVGAYRCGEHHRRGSLSARVSTEPARGVITLGGTNATSIDMTSVVTITKAGIGTTKTAGLYLDQHDRLGLASVGADRWIGEAQRRHATQLRLAVRASVGRSRDLASLLWHRRSGVIALASTGSYVDTSDSNYGLSMWCNAFVSTGGTGFRCSAGGVVSKRTAERDRSTSTARARQSERCSNRRLRLETRTRIGTSTLRRARAQRATSQSSAMGRHRLRGIVCHGDAWTGVDQRRPDRLECSLDLGNATAAIGDRMHVHGGGITITLPPVPSVVSTRMEDIIILEVDGTALGSPITPPRTRAT